MSDTWVMKGMSRENPLRIRSADELTNLINTLGFLPFFANTVPGFSVEEHTAASSWWTGNKETDPWEWREGIASSHSVVYGKFFDGRAGFISIPWLPYFANARRLGWDFDGKWQDGRASSRERNIMEQFLNVESEDEPEFTGNAILSTDLKKISGFGKYGSKNYPGILTSLQMQLYLVIGGFRRRVNKRGQEYGMAVSVIMTPESIWGYDKLSSAYDEEPTTSWIRIYEHTKEVNRNASDADIIKLIGKRP